MAYGAILGQTPTASNVAYNNSQTSSIITGTNVQSAIDQLFTSVSNGKTLIAGAITDMGVSTSPDATFQQMANNITSIVSIPKISNTLVGTSSWANNATSIPQDAIYGTFYLRYTGDSSNYTFFVYVGGVCVNNTGTSGAINIFLSGEETKLGYSARGTLTIADNILSVKVNYPYALAINSQVSWYK